MGFFENSKNLFVTNKKCVTFMNLSLNLKSMLLELNLWKFIFFFEASKLICVWKIFRQSIDTRTLILDHTRHASRDRYMEVYLLVVKTEHFMPFLLCFWVTLSILWRKLFVALCWKSRQKQNDIFTWEFEDKKL